jgi:hypothetical protein
VAPITRSPADVIREQLADYLGPFAAANAVKLYAQRALSIDPQHLTATQVPRLLQALSPTLRTLMGKETADRVIAELQRELA